MVKLCNVAGIAKFRVVRKIILHTMLAIEPEPTRS